MNLAQCVGFQPNYFGLVSSFRPNIRTSGLWQADFNPVPSDIGTTPGVIATIEIPSKYIVGALAYDLQKENRTLHALLFTQSRRHAYKLWSDKSSLGGRIVKSVLGLNSINLII